MPSPEVPSLTGRILNGQWLAGSLTLKVAFYEQQIVAVLNEAEAGAETADLRRKHGVNSATFYLWKSEFSGVEVRNTAKMRGLEDENRRLGRL